MLTCTFLSVGYSLKHVYQSREMYDTVRGTDLGKGCRDAHPPPLEMTG